MLTAEMMRAKRGTTMGKPSTAVASRRGFLTVVITRNRRVSLKRPVGAGYFAWGCFRYFWVGAGAIR